MGPSCALSEGRLPPRLADLPEPPSRLFLRGELPRGPAVAIVGTRRPSAEGAAFTRELARQLARAGVAILSGGASGVDTAAHEGALEADGVTVVVAPAGFERPFPEENAELFRRVVARGGAYLSLVPDDVPAAQAAFFPRNGCLVALAHVVIITQLPFPRSGAANASKWARALGRPLFVVPHSPWVAQGTGAIHQLRLGARPLDRAEEVLKVLAAASLHALPRPLQGQLFESVTASPSTASPSAASPGPAGDSDEILRAVRGGAGHPDEIADRTGLPLATVQRRILTLTLSGVLVPGPLGSVKLVTD